MTTLDRWVQHNHCTVDVKLKVERIVNSAMVLQCFKRETYMSNTPSHFMAKDAQGREYTILIHRTFITANTRDDPDATIDRLPRLTLKNGRPVVPVGKGNYRVVGRGKGKILTSDDPDAI